MYVKLKVVGGDTDARDLSLELPAILGRGRDVAVNLSHPLVSRRHCELFENDGRVFVKDLGSLNGTFVGSDEVTETQIASGDLLTVGTVTFRAVFEADVQPAYPIVRHNAETVRHPKSMCDTTAAPNPAPNDSPIANQ